MGLLKIIRQIRSLVVLILVLLFMQALAAETIDKIIAIVNNEVITQTDLDRAIAAIEAEYKSLYPQLQEFDRKLKEARKNIISQMVEEKLVLSEAKKFDIKADEKRIDERIEQLKEGFASDQQFETALELVGLTLKDLRDRFQAQEIMRQAVDYFVRSEIKIDPKEIKQYYQAQKNELVRPEKAHLKSILIKVDSEQNDYQALCNARGVLERLRRGGNFEELAKSCSQGPNAEEGGSLGFVEKGQLIEEIDKAVFSLKPGEFTDVIKTQQGYRIFKVEEKLPKEPLGFLEAQELIRDILYKQKFTEIFKQWIDRLKQDAFISIKEDADE